VDVGVNPGAAGFAQLRLEILRHGPPYNQLLSPLVPYLVLFGDDPASTRYVGCEHRQLIAHLKALRYGGTASERAEALRKVQGLVSDVLAEVPQLGATIGRTGARAAHLRLVLSPRELAMLPLEMAVTPEGAAGAGPLLVNALAPVCLTREVRAVGHFESRWPSRARVLMITSEAGGPVPKAAHVDALLRALDPWTGPNGEGGPAWQKVLTVLVDPDLEQIRAVVSEAQRTNSPFTHVHVLAHGGSRPEGVESRYGIVLHDARGGRLVVDGEALAAALAGGAVGSPLPAVVTVATCDVGDAGGVLEPGAGLAHELHVAGVPWVVASQFPLTQVGSVALVSSFYAAVLAGVDPREAMIEVRRRLYAEKDHNHDWASVVVYARLPPDFDEQIEAVAVAAAEWRVYHALDWAAHADAPTTVDARLAVACEGAGRLLARAERQFKTSTSVDARDRVLRLARVLGSAAKRRAERLALKDDVDAVNDALRESLVWYRRAYAYHLADHWSGGQVVSLSVVLNDGDPDTADRWSTSVFAARTERHNPALRAWALSDLLELCLLAPALPIRAADRDRAVNEIPDVVRQMVEGDGPGALIVRTTVYQMRRYTDPVFRSRLEGRAETADIPAEAAQVLELFRQRGARIPEPSVTIPANEDKE
jgi:hypothetical protein